MRAIRTVATMVALLSGLWAAAALAAEEAVPPGETHAAAEGDATALAAAAAAQRREELREARRRAEEQRLADLKRVAEEREKSCIIKPAMTDAEIAHCKWAWSFPPP